MATQHTPQFGRGESLLAGDGLSDRGHRLVVDSRVPEAPQFLRRGQRQAVIDRVEELLGRQPLLGDHRALRELGAENLLGDLPDLGLVTARTQRRRGRDRADLPERPARLGVPGRRGKAPQQHRHVGALRTVIGVELVHDHVADIRVPPQRQVLTALQQQVQHLVVRDEDVRPLPPDVRTLRHHVLVGGVGQIADVQARGDVLEFGPLEEVVDPARLVGGERVHRVEQDGLDPDVPAGTCPAAVVKHRDEERLGLTGPGTGRDQRRLGRVVPAGQPLPSLNLVQVRRGFLGCPVQVLPPVPRHLPEGGPDPQVRPPEDPVLRVVQELVQRVPHRRVRQRERGRQVLGEVLPQFFGSQRRSHRMSPSPACARRNRSLNTACACRYSATRSAL